ncbi:MAG: sigma-54-dependent Fis family transcriptional regulator [Bacteroidales bacterium]|nr:sigma-54-dependent Fis family transcriptional regulator [Bacteroidales bacterium]
MATKTKGKILVVDDNAGIRGALKVLLPLHFEQVELIASPKELMAKMNQFRPNVVLLDMNFHTDINTGNEGLYWVAELKKYFPQTEVVLFTAYADIQLAVEGMKRGAFDFVVKPWDNAKLVEILAKAVEKNRKEQKQSPQQVQQQVLPDKMIWGESPQMQAIRRTVEKIAPTEATVLITGENGTGKDVLAGEIHSRSSRCSRQMVSVDVGALTETLFESELFGHVKGAFTDAHADHTGKFEQANGGTLFLDEIGNIPIHLQGKLLRVLQNRCITRVGDTRQIPIDIRLICATNMDLEQMIRDGKFREDLYYRINTMHIVLPSLRERMDEIKHLAEQFMTRYAQKYGRNVKHIDHQALSALKLHRWRGNIRELKNAIEKAVIMSEGETLTLQDLQMSISLPDNSLSSHSPMSLGGGASHAQGKGEQEYNGETLEMQEERTIRAAMEKCGGNLSLVAKTLNISRPTLYSKLKKYNI